MTDRQRRRAVAAVLILLAVVAVAEQTRAAYGVMRHYVTGDQAIMWIAARDWGDLAFHQPTFYGQSYGTNFEGIPIEILRRVGFHLTAAAPLAYAALNVGCWLVLGAAAWRRGRHALAALAFAAPTLMTSYLSLYNAYFGMVTGRLLAAAGAAWLITEPERRVARVGAWALLITGSTLDGTALLFTAPVAAWAAIRRFRRPGLGIEVATVAVAAVPAVAWTLGLRAFFAAHPDYSMTDLVFRPHLRILRESLRDPSHFFHMFAPELWRAWWLPVAALGVLVVVLVASRRASRIVPAVLVVGLVLLALATTRAGLVRDVFVLPKARLLAGLPYALWFLLGLATGLDGPARRRSEVEPADGAGTGTDLDAGAATVDGAVAGAVAVAVAGVAVVALATAGLRLVDFDARVAAVARGEVVAPGRSGLMPSGRIDGNCRRDADLARAAGAGLVVYLHDHASAYGCAALRFEGVETLTPGWERRTWRLYDEARRRRDAALLVDVEPGFCASARPHVVSCREIRNPNLLGAPKTAAVVRFPRQPAIGLLERLGEPVRGFGPGCHLVAEKLHHVHRCAGT